MARKKKVTKKQDVKISLSEWSGDSSHIGTPTMILLPARNYHFEVSPKEYKITVPRKGVYKELDSEMFKEDDGEFLLLDEKSKILYLPAISKILFATKKYPELEPHQLFAPVALIFRDDEVDIIGQIVNMLEPPGSTAN